MQSESPPCTEPAPRPNQGKVNWWRWFWLAFLVVSLGYAWHCFYVPPNSVAWAENYASAQQKAVQSGKPIIIFFTGKWCVPCRIMKRNVWADEQVTAAVNAAYIPVMIDVDAPGAAAEVTRYGVGATPNTIITEPQGNVLQQKAGGMNKGEFLEMLGKVNPAP